MVKTSFNYKYRDLERFSRDIGISKENLIRGFEIEQAFNINILKETDRKKRKHLYEEVYEKVHPIYGNLSQSILKRNLIRIFAKELRGSTILDVGCGNGTFLINVAKLLGNNRLVGIDISSSIHPKDQKYFHFIFIGIP